MTDLTLGDSDGDGLLDGWEVEHGLDPTDDGSDDPVNGPDGDLDGDGLTNTFEAALGTDPLEPDTVQVPLTTGLLAVILLALGAAVTWRVRRRNTYLLSLWEKRK